MASKRKRVAPIDVESAIKEELEKYGVLANSVVSESIADVAAEAERRLHAVNRFALKGDPTGEYSRDWDTINYSTGRFSSTAVVYNIDNYRLTHLLEFGHVNRNGTGREFGRTPAYPHISPINDWAHDEVIRQIEKRLGNL